jgi:hypothetical protein
VGTPPARALGRGWRLASVPAAAIPVIAATVEGLREGATPTGDRAIILTRSFDVFSGHSPLVGQFSASSLLYGHVHGHVLHSLGPLLYWLLALPVRIGAAVAPQLAIAAVNVLALTGSIVLAHRRGGLALALATAIALTLMCGSLPAETLHDVWNPSAALLPFTLLLFVSWSVGCGEARLLPLAALLASFTAQCELVFFAPSALALAVGVLGLLTSAHGRRRAAWRWWLAALATFALCWSFPIADELQGHPGNLTLLAEAAFSHGHTIGLAAGWHALVRTLGIAPWWLTASHNPFGRLAEVKAAPGSFAQISCMALLLALVGVAMLGAWRRRGDLAWAATIGLGLCASLTATTGSTPSRPSLESSLGYMLWIGSPIGMFAWLTLVWAAATLAGPSLLARSRRAAPWLAGRERRVRTMLALAGLACAFAAGAAVAAGQGPDQDRPEYGPVKRVQAAVRRAIAGRVVAGRAPDDRGRVVLVTGSHRFTSFDFRAAVIYDLRRRGWRVYAPAAAERLGAYYEPTAGRLYLTVWIFDEPRPPRGGRVIARLVYGASPRKTLTVIVSKSPWPTARRARASGAARRSGARRVS